MHFAAVCDAVGRWYNNGQICLERTGVGIATLESLLNAGYPPSLLYKRPVQPDQDPQLRSDRLGWDTSEVSRQQLIGILDELLRQGALFIRDPAIQQELLTFCINPRGKAEAQRGCHDDLVFGAALAGVVLTRMERPLPSQAPENVPGISNYLRRAERKDERGRIVRVR